MGWKVKREVRGIWPNRLVADYCIRCSKLFKDGQIAALVQGNAQAQYRDLAIEVCRECVLAAFDVRVALVKCLYDDGNRGFSVWPNYGGSAPMPGFLKLARLENGVIRVGLHRGHAEVWTVRKSRRRHLGQGACRGTGL